MVSRSSLRVLVGCEYSGIVRNAFLDEGLDAWSCDLLPAEDGSNRHIRGDVRTFLRMAGTFSSWRTRRAHAFADKAGAGFPDRAT